MRQNDVDTHLEALQVEPQLESDSSSNLSNNLSEAESEAKELESDLPEQIPSDPTVRRYFETFNTQDFQATACLFAAEGALHPPFEAAVVGSAAIADYLKREAKGMRALPKQETVQVLEDGTTEYKVAGKVLTPLFGVNVAWQFVVDSQSKILSTRVKLLAALEELLSLKR